MLLSYVHPRVRDFECELALGEVSARSLSFHLLRLSASKFMITPLICRCGCKIRAGAVVRMRYEKCKLCAAIDAAIRPESVRLFRGEVFKRCRAVTTKRCFRSDGRAEICCGHSPPPRHCPRYHAHSRLTARS